MSGLTLETRVEVRSFNRFGAISIWRHSKLSDWPVSCTHTHTHNWREL